MLAYLILVAIAVLAAIVGCAQLSSWAMRPIVHQGLALAELDPLIRSWGPWLDERGRIVVRHAETGAEVELRKRRFAGRPDALTLRVRNADGTAPCFAAIRRAFDEAAVPYDLELTRKRRRPRALAVPLMAEDIHAPAAASKLVERIFAAVGVESAGFRVHCEGRMRTAPNAPPVRLVPWRRDFAAGERVGRFVGRLLARWGR